MNVHYLPALMNLTVRHRGRSRAKIPVSSQPILSDEKLKAVIQNLVNNAIKFTEKGVVKISVRHRVEAGMMEYKIADTGTGIAKEKLDSIFDMFLQVDSSATRKYGGVGLGLYIVKKFTELLGGRVTVESEVGKGSTFTVILPTSPAGGCAASLPATSSQETDASMPEGQPSDESGMIFYMRSYAINSFFSGRFSGRSLGFPMRLIAAWVLRYRME